MARNPLYAFLLKGALWLPPCLALWYWLAEWFNAPAARLSGWVMRSMFRWVESAEWSQRVLSLNTSLRMDKLAGMPEGIYTLVLEVNPLIYGYGLPLFAALVLAGAGTKRWRKLVLGALLLIPFQAWGICFDLLKQAAISSGAGVTAQLGMQSWQLDGIALGYQFGTLILPAVMPVVLWLAFNRSFIPMLVLEGEMGRQRD